MRPAQTIFRRGLLTGLCLLLAATAQAQDSFELRLSQAEAQLSISAQRALEMIRELRAEAEAANNPFRTLDAMHLESEALADLGDNDAAYALAEEALQRAIQLGDPLRHSDPLRRRANIHIDRNEYDQAEALLFEALELISGSVDELREARAYGALARVRRYQVRYPEALVFNDRALAIFQALERERDIADLIAFRGVVMELMGQFEPALAAHTEALERLRRINDLSGVATALFNIAEIHRELGDQELSLAYLQDVLEMDQRIGNKLNIAYSYNMVGQGLSDIGRHDEAREHIVQAVQMFGELGAQRDRAWAQGVLARTEMATGNLERARELLDEALATANERDSRSLIPILHMRFARLEILAGNPEAAVGHARSGIVITQQNDEADREEELTGILANALEAQGDLRGAIVALRRQQDLRTLILNNTRSQAFALMQSQAEFVRREQQIDLLKKDQALQAERVQRQQLIRNAWIAGLLAAFVIFALLFARHAQRRVNANLAGEVSNRTRELSAANRELAAAYEAVEDASLTDQLTGLRNRRFLDHHVDADVMQVLRQYADRSKHPSGDAWGAEDLVFLLIDLDHFKAVNDQYGHALGDRLLQAVAEAITTTLRPSDYVVRWGGEEFLAVARFVSRRDAADLAERIRKAVAEVSIQGAAGQQIKASCSVGFACLPLMPGKPNAMGWRSVVDIADICLYAAKHSGRDAWIGIRGSEPLPDLLRLLRQAPEQLVSQQHIEVITSLADPQAIRWQ